MCSVIALDATGNAVTYYRMVGKPTKTLTGTVATVKPCNSESLAINPQPCKECEACRQCADLVACGSVGVGAYCSKIQNIPNGNCFHAVYDKSKIVNGEIVCE